MEISPCCMLLWEKGRHGMLYWIWKESQCALCGISVRNKMNSVSSQSFWSFFSGNHNYLNVTNNAGGGWVGGQNWLIIWVKQGQGLNCNCDIWCTVYHPRSTNSDGVTFCHKFDLQGFDETPDAGTWHLAPQFTGARRHKRWVSEVSLKKGLWSYSTGR